MEIYDNKKFLLNRKCKSIYLFKTKYNELTTFNKKCMAYNVNQTIRDIIRDSGFKVLETHHIYNNLYIIEIDNSLSNKISRFFNDHKFIKYDGKDFDDIFNSKISEDIIDDLHTIDAGLIKSDNITL